MKKAYTLIELLLYVGLLAIIMSIVSYFLFASISAKVKNRTIAEVEQQGEMAMQMISQTIRNSSAINSPISGANAGTLSLNIPDLTKTPTIFSLSAGKIQIQEGTGIATDLTSSRIVITNLIFQNISRPSTPGVIRVGFTASYNDPNGRNEYQFSKNFYCSASRRY